MAGINGTTNHLTSPSPSACKFSLVHVYMCIISSNTCVAKSSGVSGPQCYLFVKPGHLA